MTANPSIVNANEQLINRLLDNLPTGYTSATVKLPNRTFNQPNNDKWLRATVISQTATNTQAGGFWMRFEGQFVVDIFYPVGNDTIAQLQDAETIQTLYQNLRIDGVNCQSAMIDEIGQEDSWYHVQINIDFYYEG